VLENSAQVSGQRGNQS